MALPPKGAFYSKLNMSGVRDQDYEHACNVILLANIFESFRKVCLDNYGLDPVHFYTAPGLAWQACLKKTGVRLELLLSPVCY